MFERRPSELGLSIHENPNCNYLIGAEPREFSVQGGRFWDFFQWMRVIHQGSNNPSLGCYGRNNKTIKHKLDILSCTFRSSSSNVVQVGILFPEGAKNVP